MTQHTQGEWTYVKHGISGNRKCTVYGQREDGRKFPIAEISRFKTEAEEEANARLIAAAPKLLEALKIADAQLCNMRDSLYDEGKAKIRAAIAAAKGE